ncbi:thioredoxin domain-containing protein [Rhodothermus profundi]|uniref:Spermatogenesis-associated protein 20-like TRX domain-containing protein n=1 Tax=Rhodothermus profundi TaxID=633813 RepID=A0A1M6XG89_9BACT|nr:thioredoxin domain-containing protein [Rhodothermus profundi]SHL05004.1 hypothetical protein SAMN04488087_2593 [Rhodothermus profundi]
MPNRLQFEKSPYLLQHKDDPVDWWPWCEEAFARAKAEDKPVFLSIGYAACHWCHVMAHESFQDEEVARLMNDAFINIKVDREERPDVDQLYMTVCQMVTGHGGWPLTIIMTPDRKPFFAATYIPKRSRYGRPGLLEIIPRIQEAWRQHRDEIIASAEKLTGTLQKIMSFEAPSQIIDAEWLEIAYRRLDDIFDARHGGFGHAPKFPTPHTLLFLLRYWQRSGEAHALQMVEHTLMQMRLGGIYDHVGFGFHRYATDEAWRVPHFEKMLYDQALLTIAYTEAYQATGKSFYARTAREILTYVLRDLRAPEGAFYSSEDADSEGEEGKFYVWTVAELREALGPELAPIAIDLFNVQPEGNYEEEATGERTGKNILYLSKSLQALARERGWSLEELETTLATIRERLFAYRMRRVRPGRDEKILTDWNGLMIAALARAAQVFDEAVYAEAAQTAADFLLRTMRTPEGRLWHRYRDGEAGISGMLDDYAFLSWGLLDLYEATFEEHYLETALALTEQMLTHFWDARGVFYMTPDDGEPLIVRPRETMDNAMPSGNAVALMNLVRLGHMTGRTNYAEHADAMIRFFSGPVKQQPPIFTGMLVSIDFAFGPIYELVLAGDLDNPDLRELLRTIHQRYLPRKVLMLRRSGAAGERLVQLAPFVAAQEPVDGRPTVYVCHDYRCEQPVTDPEELARQLDALHAGAPA